MTFNLKYETMQEDFGYKALELETKPGKAPAPKQTFLHQCKWLCNPRNR